MMGLFDRLLRRHKPIPPPPPDGLGQLWQVGRSPGEHLTTDENDPALGRTDATGMQEKYLILSDEERAKGFVRPLRTAYKHLRCGGITRMGLKLSETYARNPRFYSGTFCAPCGAHFDLVNSEGNRTFVWDEDGEGVGS